MKRSNRVRGLSRRSLLASAAATGLAGCGTGTASTQMRRVPLEGPALVEARKKAAHRQRRLVYYDPGDMVYHWKPETGMEGFFDRLRITEIEGTPVDSYVWGIMWSLATEGPAVTRYWEVQKLGKRFHPLVPDPTPVVIDAYKKLGIEIFGEIRMNDTHDAHGFPFPKLVYPLKVNHPEFLLGDESQRFEGRDGKKTKVSYKKTLAGWMWSGLNYAHAEVRNDRFWWIDHAASHYDLDGVDLNFFRHPWFFKVGEEARHMHLMTDLIRRVRRRFDQISRRRGRPVLLCVRTPDTVEACLRIGLDIETWLKEGLIDRILCGGGYVPFSTPAEQMVDLGHRHEVPVYPCINVGIGIMADQIEAIRGAASNLWWAGGDGLYLWNWMYRGHRKAKHPYGEPPDSIYPELNDIGDRKRLARLDKIFAVDCVAPIWYYARASAPCPLPTELGTKAGDAVKTVPVRIGDDIPEAARTGILRDVTLQVQLAGDAKGDRVHVRFNGAELGLGKPRGDHWTDYILKPESVKQGINDLQVAVAERGASAGKALVLKQAWVSVRYQS